MPADPLALFAVAARLSAADARSAVVAAELPPAGDGDARATLRRLGAIQLDPISRVERAHRLTAIARASGRGRVAADRLDGALWPAGELAAFEAWTHALCLLPIELWPLWRARRERAASRLERHREASAAATRVLDVLAAHTGTPDAPGGGLGLGELEADAERSRGWSWSGTKLAVELLVRAGEVVVDRHAGSRRFDLASGRVPARLLEAAIDPDEADERLARLALRAHGVLAPADLARRIALPRRAADALAARLAAGGAPVVEVEGWPMRALAVPDALEAAAPRGAAWIGPFDSLLWDRPRALRLFGIDYRLEAYVPAAERTHGPYAMLGLVDGRATALADLRSDRRAGALELLRLAPLPGRQPVARAVAGLGALARRLGLAAGVVDRTDTA